jgi:hypothetical protein
MTIALQSQIIQLLSIGATTLFITLLVAFELTPAMKRRRSLKVLLPCFVALGVVMVTTAHTK